MQKRCLGSSLFSHIFFRADVISCQRFYVFSLDLATGHTSPFEAFGPCQAACFNFDFLLLIFTALAVMIPKRIQTISVCSVRAFTFRSP